MPVRRARSAWTTRAAADWTPRVGPVHLLRHHVLGVEEVDDGQRLHAALPLDQREVADPEVLELPEGLDAEVVAARPLVQAAVGAQAEDPGLEHLEGGLEAVERDAGDERAEPSRGGRRPPPPRPGRLPRGDLGPVGQGDRHQVVEVPARVDQRDLDVVVLQRLDDGAGVQPQHPGEPGALDPPLLPRRDGLLLQVGEHVPGPVDLERRDQVAGSARRSGRPRRAPARRCRASRRTCRGTGGRGSRRRRSACRASFLAVWTSQCRAFRTCRATRGW